jgi:glycine oxidase
LIAFFYSREILTKQLPYIRGYFFHNDLLRLLRFSYVRRMEVDYIIVGQGLAGSAVAVQLLKLKKKIVVFDNPSSNCSSRIAAGLFNPITGKKMTKTWLADQIFPCLHEFYTSVEKMTNSSFFFPMPLYRPFLSIEEQNEWMARSNDEMYRTYVKRIFTSSGFAGLKDDKGGLLLHNAGFLDTEEYIRAVGILIGQNGTLIREVLNPERLVVDDDGIRYGEIKAKKIIFCSGTVSTNWFKWIPIRPLKGETITIRNNFNEKVIVNRGVYMVPGNQPGLWRIGSTYHFHDQVPATTPEGRSELEEKLMELNGDPYEVTDHHWGFRPTTPDRRPILGRHPQHQALVVFNGLGTKGVSLAPYFSEVLVHSLENRGSIHKEVDVKRFKSLYWGSPE